MSRSMSATLRAVADLIDEHPDLPLPYISVYDHAPHEAYIHWYLHINDKGGLAEQKAAAQAILRALGGKWGKGIVDGNGTMRFSQTRDGLGFDVQVARDAVCERVVVGTEEVTIPAVDAQPERTEVREVVEWRCEPVLAEAQR